MKAQSTGKNSGGFATLEILIAFAMIILSISAVILLAFGNQSVAIDSETNNEALYKAEQMLEEARSDSRKNFLSVLPVSYTDILGGLTYDKKLEVADLSQCKKQATSIVSWYSSFRSQKITLTTLLSDIKGVFDLGGDCDDGVTDDFDNPGGLVSTTIGGQGATSIDAINNSLYVTSNKFPPPGNHDFFVYDFDATPVPSLSLVDSLDLNEGLNDVDVAGQYAYVASANTDGQLQVIDLALMNRIDTATRKLKDTTGAIGRVVYVYQEKVYIGTQYLACPPTCPGSQNNEFHIYSISTPGDPVWQASVNINHNVNDIIVVGDFAYLATSDNNHELMVININPSNLNYLKHPDETGFGYDALGNNDGSRLYVLGDKVYLGRLQNTPASSHDFFILKRDDLLSGVSTSDGLINSIDLGIQNNALVTGIVIRGKLAFIGLDDSNFGLKILDITTMLPPSNCAGFNFPENSTGMDMSGNFIFTSNTSNDEIQVIYDQPSICPL